MDKNCQIKNAEDWKKQQQLNCATQFFLLVQNIQKKSNCNTHVFNVCPNGTLSGNDVGIFDVFLQMEVSWQKPVIISRRKTIEIKRSVRHIFVLALKPQFLEI